MNFVPNHDIASYIPFPVYAPKENAASKIVESLNGEMLRGFNVPNDLLRSAIVHDVVIAWCDEHGLIKLRGALHKDEENQVVTLHEGITMTRNLLTFDFSPVIPYYDFKLFSHDSNGELVAHMGVVFTLNTFNIPLNPIDGAMFSDNRLQTTYVFCDNKWRAILSC